MFRYWSTDGLKLAWVIVSDCLRPWSVRGLGGSQGRRLQGRIFILAFGVEKEGWRIGFRLRESPAERSGVEWESRGIRREIGRC